MNHFVNFNKSIILSVLLFFQVRVDSTCLLEALTSLHEICFQAAAISIQKGESCLQSIFEIQREEN